MMFVGIYFYFSVIFKDVFVVSSGLSILLRVYAPRSFLPGPTRDAIFVKVGKKNNLGSIIPVLSFRLIRVFFVSYFYFSFFLPLIFLTNILSFITLF